jgi:hypothetical protein
LRPCCGLTWMEKRARHSMVSFDSLSTCLFFFVNADKNCNGLLSSHLPCLLIFRSVMWFDNGIWLTILYFLLLPSAFSSHSLLMIKSRFLLAQNLASRFLPSHNIL